MGSAFFTPGTKHIRDVLDDAFSPNNVQYSATDFSSIFNPAGGLTLAEIADTNEMDIPPTGSIFWPTLHGRFQKFLKDLLNADPVTHTKIKQAMYTALTANPAMPMQFYVAHQDVGYNFVSWDEEDDSGLLWRNCLLFCPEMKGPVAKRLRRIVKRKLTRGRRRSKSTKK